MSAIKVRDLWVEYGDQVVLWADTGASLRRLAIGLAIATLIGLSLGLAIGVSRW